MNGEFIDIAEIHQILISDTTTRLGDLPPVVAANVYSIKHQHPGARHFLWGADELQAFIAGNFSNDVLDAYNTLAAYTAKADLGRYCLLLVRGGLYSDLSNRFLAPMRIPVGRSVACFRDAEPYGGAPWATTPTILYAERGREELRAAIDLLVDNVKRRQYGVNALCPTGPILFGRALAMINRPECYWAGTMVPLSGTHPRRTHAFMGPDGTMVAVRMQREGGGTAELGLKGTNNYNKLWEQRRYFGEGPPVENPKTTSLWRWLRGRDTDRRSEQRTETLPPPSSPPVADHRRPEVGSVAPGGPTSIGTIKCIHYIILECDEAFGNASSAEAKENIEAVRNLHPGVPHQILRDTDLQAFISANFSSEVSSAYEALPVGPLRTELGSYCLLLVHGGLYIDFKTRFLNTFSPPSDRTLACFRAAAPKDGASDDGVFWAVSNTVILAAPDQDEIKLALDLTIANMRAVLSGEVARYATASATLGRAMAMLYRPERYWVGEMIPIPASETTTLAGHSLITPDGTLVALRCRLTLNAATSRDTITPKGEGQLSKAIRNVEFTDDRDMPSCQHRRISPSPNSGIAQGRLAQ
jgi:hypothetical protein